MIRQLGIFIWKEVRHILRDRRSLIILIGLPVAQVLLFGFAITNEVGLSGMVVYDPSGSDAAQRLVKKMESTGYFQTLEWVSSTEEFQESFQRTKAKVALQIPADFPQPLLRGEPTTIQVVADATDPNTATTLISYARAVIFQFQQEELGRTTGQDLPLRINTETRMLYNPTLASVSLFVPGVMTVILLLVSALMTSIALTREKENGNMELLLVSPLRPGLIILGKVIPYIALSLGITIIILVLSIWVFNMPIRGNILLLFLECGLFVLTALSLGILISTRTETQQVAMMISLVALMMPTILLSGFIFPIESMPVILQWVSHVIPAKWFIIILRSVMLQGNGLEVVWFENLVLVGMTLFFLLVSIRNFNIRLA